MKSYKPLLLLFGVFLLLSFSNVLALFPSYINVTDNAPHDINIPHEINKTYFFTNQLWGGPYIDFKEWGYGNSYKEWNFTGTGFKVNFCFRDGQRWNMTFWMWNNSIGLYNKSYATFLGWVNCCEGYGYDYSDLLVVENLPNQFYTIRLEPGTKPNPSCHAGSCLMGSDFKYPFNQTVPRNAECNITLDEINYYCDGFTYGYRYDIFSNSTTDIPVSINDTGLFNGIPHWGMSDSTYVYCQESGCASGIYTFGTKTDERYWERTDTGEGYKPTSVWEDAVVILHLDEGTGCCHWVTTKDSSPNNNTIYLFGKNGPDWRSSFWSDISGYANGDCPFGNCMFLDGKIWWDDEFIRLNEIRDDLNESKFTMTLWATGEWRSGDYRLFNYWTNSSNHMSYHLNGGKLSFSFQANGISLDDVCSFDLKNDLEWNNWDWHFLAVTVDLENNEVKCYADDNYKTVTISDTVWTGDFAEPYAIYMGRRYCPNDEGSYGGNDCAWDGSRCSCYHSGLAYGQWWRGAFDEIWFFNKILQPNELREIYYNGINNLTYTLGEEDTNTSDFSFQCREPPFHTFTIDITDYDVHDGYVRCRHLGFSPVEIAESETSFSFQAEAICGDNYCSELPEENQGTCCIDCGCPFFFTCVENVCKLIIAPFLPFLMVVALIGIVARRVYEEELDVEKFIHITIFVIITVILISVLIMVL